MLPFIDLYILLELTGEIGFANVLLIILGTGIIGAEIARRQWREIAMRLGSSVTIEEVSRNLLETFLLGIGSLMLIIPGILTDIAGAVLIFPPTRQRLTYRIAKSVKSSSKFDVRVESF